MIIKSLQLHPFAGVKDRRFDFASGLNVVCGPNDIGKSTLFRAIEHAFFLDVKVKSNTIDGQTVKQSIPIGGDHARVSLEFESEADGKSYVLRKVWGAGASCLLECSDGTVLNSAEKIGAKLAQLLPVAAATFKNVLSVGQNQLDQTMAQLKKSQESLHSLGDLLRVAMSQTDGISVDRLKAQLREKLRLAFDRWDKQGPEGGRGIERPWAQPGTILKAWYERENLRKQRDETLSLETMLGDRAKQLSEMLEKQATARLFIKEHAPFVETIDKKKALQLQLQHAEKQLLEATGDKNAWDRAEITLEMIAPEIAHWDMLVANLKAEQQQAREAVSRRHLVERFQKIEVAIAQKQTLEHALGQLQRVPVEEIESLQLEKQLHDQLKASLAAAELALRFIPKLAMAVKLQQGLEPGESRTLAAGEEWAMQAGGMLRIENEFFELKVSAGHGHIEELERKAQAAQARADAVRSRLGVQTLAEARELQERFERAKRNLDSAADKVKTWQGTDRLEDLRELYAAASGAAATRDPSIVDQEVVGAVSALTAKLKERTDKQEALARLTKLYGSIHELSMLIATRNAALSQAKLELEALPSIPPTIVDASDLVRRFKSAHSELQAHHDLIARLSAEVADLKARLPEQSAQDFDRQLREADQAFARELKRGHALLRVQTALDKLETQSQDIYRDLQEDFFRALSLISSDKYGRARMDGSLPQEFIRFDGTPVPFDWLSAGTKDGFALSLRLTMAQHFLAGSQGFLLLDDPMVSMDPERQRRAAEILRNFAAQTQLIAFTCHPSHAELLGGRTILFEAPLRVPQSPRLSSRESLADTL